ncbi:MAG TPA: PLP-dependent aminotransferase family protein [Streptosporangiaceae bacterium]
MDQDFPPRQGLAALGRLGAAAGIDAPAGRQPPRHLSEMAWWVAVVFDGWQQRPGPRYQRLAGAVAEAVASRALLPGTRVPAERILASAVGVSRGTVVACFDELVQAGVLRRRQGSGTYVVGRPSWASSVAPTSGAAGLLLRRMADDRSAIDLSVSAPSDLRHLPVVDLGFAWGTLDGHGLDPRGLPALRAEVARHLTAHQRLPTSAEQIVVTGGAQEALWLLARVLRPSRVLASCPTYPGLASGFGGDTITAVPADAAGTEANALARQAGSVAYVMPTGHNPTGLVMSSLRRQAIAAIADAGRTIVIEDLALADLVLEDGSANAAPLAAPPPLAALSSEVIAIGSVSKLLWGGLRVGWIRLGEDRFRGEILARKAALNLATSSVAQAVAAQLLAAVDEDWLKAHRAALAKRRDHLCSLIEELLPAWRAARPAAGLSLWIWLPVADAEAFAAVAARYGVVVSVGGTACVDGRHRGYIRLSFAEQLDVLSLAVERLAAAWEAHTQTLAASPMTE